MKLSVAACCLFFGVSLTGMAEPAPTSAPSKKDFDERAKEVTEAEKQLALAIGKKDTESLAKVLAEGYFDVYEGDKRAMSKLQAIARCKAGLLRYLAIEKEAKMTPKDDVVVVEGEAKLIPNVQDDTVPPMQWVHVKRLWTKKSGAWILTCQLRHLEGDAGEVD
ncbi:MAG: nuclear transport factor 2 family protein [Chthoniobacterales bacterium]